MKPFLYLLLILPAGLNAQTGVDISKTQLPVGTIEYSASVASTAALISKLEELKESKKSTVDQLKSLTSLVTPLQIEIASLKKRIADLGSHESTKAQRAELERQLVELIMKLNQVMQKIEELKHFLASLDVEIKEIMISINQMRKKMEETAVKDRQLTESKNIDETKKTATIDEEKALAYAHVRIIIDSLPGVFSKLSLAERNLVSGLNSRFNLDGEFQSATSAYIKHSKASNYFGVMSKSASSTDRINRLLVAAREEMVILSRN